MASEELNQAVLKIKNGDSLAGRAILLRLIKANPHNETAWLWLVESLSSSSERILALEQCLKYNPGSQIARRGLEHLKKAQPAVPTAAPALLTPETAKPDEGNLPVPKTGAEVTKDRRPSETSPSNLMQKARAPKTKSRRVNLPLLLGLLALLICTAFLTLAWIATRGNGLPPLPGGANPGGALPSPLQTLPGGISHNGSATLPAATGTPMPSATPLSFDPLVPDRQVISPANLENVRPLGVIGSGIFYSPGNLIAKSQGRQVVVWDASRNAILQTLTAPGKVVNINFSPDGQHLAASTTDLNIMVWDTDSGKLVQILSFPPGDVDGIYQQSSSLKDSERVVFFDFSPDGQFIAGRAMGMLATWRLADGQRLAYFLASPAEAEQKWMDSQANPPGVESRAYFRAVFSPDSQKLAVSGYGAIKVINAADGLLLAEHAGSDDGAATIAFTPDSRSLILGGVGTLSLVDFTNWETIHSFPGLKNSEYPAWYAFAVDGKSIYLEEDGQCCFQVVMTQYDLKTFKLKSSSPPSESRVEFSFSPDGSLSIFGNRLSAPGGKQLTLPNASGLRFTPDGRAILAEMDRKLTVFGVSATGEPVSLVSRPVQIGKPSQGGAPFIVGEIAELNGAALLTANGELSSFDPHKKTLETVKQLYDYQNYFGLTRMGKNLYFFTIDNQNALEIWKSDGSAQGTRNFWSSKGVLIDAGIPGTKNRSVTAAGNILFFVGHDTIQGLPALWRSDGTASGTFRLAEFFTDFMPDQPPYSLTGVGNRLFFMVQGKSGAQGLWVSDGTERGTRLVKEFLTGSAGSPHALVEWDGALYFSADDGSRQPEVWKSDGSAAGTLPLSGLLPGGDFQNINRLVVAGKMLYLVVEKAGASEIWRADGSKGGTERLWSGNSQLVAPLPALTGAGDSLFFAVPQLWKSDGTVGGTRQVGNVSVEFSPGLPAAGQDVRLMAAIGDTVYFGGSDGVHGGELWQTDGTTAGTRMLADLAPGAQGIDPDMIISAAGMIFFRDNRAGFWVYVP